MAKHSEVSLSSFNSLKQKLSNDHQLKQEVEWLLQLGLEKFNPSERGNRWIAGSIVEWTLALALFESGVIILPEGHNANGHDLIDMRDNARGLWSVKSSFQGKPSDFIITNGLGGAGSGLSEVTVFLHPKLEGIVYVDPLIHFDVVNAVVARGGESRLPFGALKQHAEKFPENVIPLNIPENKGTNFHGDPGLDAVRMLTETGVFSRLNRPFRIVESRSGDVVTRLREINSLVRDGSLTDAQAAKAIDQLLA